MKNTELNRRRKVFIALGLLLMGVVSCVPGSRKGPVELTYTAPVEISVKAGETLPGSSIRYVGKTEKGAEVLIAGQHAFKQKGDSLDWKGDLLEGVSVDLSLRTLWFTEETLHLVGTGKVVVRQPNPQPASIQIDWPLKFTNAPVTYGVARNEYIPGTTIEYLGKEEEGAHLGGVDGYPYRKGADSILWEGKLREKVYLRLNVRALYIGEKSLRVGGTADIWIVP
ncbi:MAG: hypothetical protein ACETWR_11475 [Anaerolineae bacterium]